MAIYTRDRNRYLKEWGAEAQTTWNDAEETYKSESIYMEKFKQNINSLSDMDALAISDLLGKILAKTLSHMKYDASTNYTNGIENSLRYILTVPTHWSQENRDTMRQLAIKANLVFEKDHSDRLQIINESLAASLYCENELKPALFKPGFRYLICDVGGGAVNTTIYEIIHADNTRVERCQLTMGSDPSCGSALLDERMKELLIEILFQPKMKNDYKNYENLVSKPLDDFINIYKVQLQKKL